MAYNEPAEIELRVDRPDGRFFYTQSQDFYWDNADLLPQGHGVVCQEFEPLQVLPKDASKEEIQQRLDELSGPQQPHKTVLFDARQRDQGIFTWQYTTATDEGRSQVNLIISEFGSIQGNETRYDSAGHISTSNELTDEDANAAWQQIDRLILGNQARELAKSLRLQREKLGQAFDEFKDTHDITQVVSSNHLSGKARVISRLIIEEDIIVDGLPEKVEKELAVVKTELFGHRLDKELEKRGKQLAELGFTAIAPTKPIQQK